MIASLPMYWDDASAPAWRAMWAQFQSIASRHGLDLPSLTEPQDLPADWTDHWMDPDLILSQTCSLPLRTKLKDSVTYVGTFDYGLPCPSGQYYSARIARHGPCPHPRLAINGYDSQSGWAAAQTEYETGVIREVIVTGSHAASAFAVAQGTADVAYLDAVTLRHLQDQNPDVLAALQVTQNTRPTPGLPLITAKGRDPMPLRAALQEAAETLRWHANQSLWGLRSFHVLDPAEYFAQPIPQTA